MKRRALIFALIAFTLCFSFGCSEKKTIVGKWIDDETEAITEYTEDGYYYEYANEGFTTDKTKYSLKKGKIVYYIEGEAPETGFEVDYEINDEGELIINGEIKYRPMTLSENEQKAE